MKRIALLALLLTVVAAANFAAVDGFSGRSGFDCSSCHTQPIQDDAVAILEGLPANWTAGASYTLSIRVEGGPVANPTGPQGGFELDVNGGRLQIPENMDGLLRITKHGITYLPEGTLMREWNVIWEAPSLTQQPKEITFWLAVVSANGNHDHRTNSSVQGEFGDSVATLTLKLPPSDETIAAWESLPLAPPTLIRNGSRIEGVHNDANATGIRYQLDGEWVERTTGTHWMVQTSEDVAIQSIGAGRNSDFVSLDPSKAAPGLPLLAFLLLVWRRP